MQRSIEIERLRWCCLQLVKVDTIQLLLQASLQYSALQNVVLRRNAGLSGTDITGTHDHGEHQVSERATERWAHVPSQVGVGKQRKI